MNNQNNQDELMSYAVRMIAYNMATKVFVAMLVLYTAFMFLITTIAKIVS